MATERPLDELTPLQSAVYLVKQTQAKLAALEQSQAEPLAVIGMACRFPGGSDNLEAYWRLLRDGVDGIIETPPERWDVDQLYDPDPTVPGKMSTRWGGFVQHVDEFDADFFGISPREAIRVDPQQRLLLEVAWEALEDAGLPAEALAQTKTGVFVGALGSDYALLEAKDPSDMDIFSGTGIAHSILANRISYVLNLLGPSVSLDTACSSSLVTVHLAAQSLRRRESDMAIAGGVNLMLSPETTLGLTKAHMMAPDGRCKTFDAAANGYVRGEGCGLIVMKRLSDALAARDRIIAVIRGSAVNHDGRSNGLSAPNGLAQEAVLRAALADARLAPMAINYIEAHGTGTRLGDPIEIEALRSVFCPGRSAEQPLVVGSVKTNIGHLESAAGVAGLVKIMLMLQHEEIAPHLHLKTLNPLLKIEDVPVQIPTAKRPWPRGAVPRRAGVSSFGFGGTNAHVILEEAPAEESPATTVERPRHVVTLSARSEQALAELAGRYVAYAESAPAASLANIAYTANTGRSHGAARAAVAAASVEQLRDQLQRFVADPASADIHHGVVELDRPPQVAFLFTGQGAQYAGMGNLLYQTQPTFREALDRCAEILRPLLDRPLLELLDPQAGTQLDQTGNTQPVMFALEYALATLWRSWGVEPSAVMGHSVGEFAAACVAGVLSLEDGLQLIAQRARLMQSLPAGGLMAAVFAGEGPVAEALAPYADQVTIAALNGPENTVISGDEPAVRDLLARFAAAGVQSKTLVTSHAFHSQRMDPILEPLRQAAAAVACGAPKLDLIANLTGQVATEQTFADPAYWSRHARSPVRFHESIKLLAERGCELFLEIGPSPTLVGMGRRCLPEGTFAWLPSLRPGRDDWQAMLDSLAQLYVRGVRIDWSGFDRDYRRRKTSLPTYPFQRRRYWPNLPTDSYSGGGSALQRKSRVVHPLLGRRLVAAVQEQVFEAQVAARRPETLSDHRIQGVVIMPGSAYLEAALAASAILYGKPWQVCQTSLLEPLLLDKTPTTLQTIVAQEGPGAASFRIVSIDAGEGDAEPVFTTHAVGRLEAAPDTEVETVDLADLRSRFTGEPFSQAWREEALRKSGLEPGPTFCWGTQHWVNGLESFGEIRAPRDTDKAEQYQIHPGLLDTLFQGVGAALPGAGTGIDAYVPMSTERFRLFGCPREAVWSRAIITSLEANAAVGEIELYDAAGRVLASLEGVRLRRVPRDWLARLVAGPLPDWTNQLAWVAQAPAPAPAPASAPASAPAAVQDAAQGADASPAAPAAPAPAPVAELGRWLLFDTQEGIGATLAERFQAKAQRCTLVPPGGDAESRRAAVRAFLSENDPPARGIVYLPGLDVDGQPTTPDFAAARQYGWGGVLDVVQACGESASQQPPRLWVVTRGAQSVGERPLPMSLAQAPTWGLGRVIALEHPELNCARIDLDPENPAEAVDRLVEEIEAPAREDQVAYREGKRYMARLRRLRRGGAGALKPPPGQPYRLEITTRGQLDNVALRPMRRNPPGPGQVEIQVRATGLNFRDVLNVLDLYPGDPGPLGGECAGEVVAVGAGVEHLKVGDRVVGLCPASFASYALTLGEFAVPLPETLSDEEAATIPICFLTVQHALRHLGQMKAGERLLIHAASGGVGLAAIQIARQVGAEIFATAGSPKKREYLQSLGITHVMNSRSLEFAEQIKEATHGEGVDLVLNSLTGETIGASLSVLRAGGRFLELGKTDLWDQQRVDEFRPGVKFFPIALDQMMAETPQIVGELMREVLPQFASGQLQPLPLRKYRIPHVVDALRLMARAEHIGKVVIQAAQTDSSERAFALSDQASYLITGGLGGLGLKVAHWLADRGARHLVLVGRSAPSEDAQRQLESLQQSGVQVLVRRCDVGDRAEVAAVLASLGSDAPLRGIFHLAGVLDDGVLREQTRERFDRVMASKVFGAWNLHELTRDLPLDMFVLFSSAASLLGSPGQGNYAAANAFLDALAHHRRWQKLPALSVNWGAWAEVGMAARLQEADTRRLSAAGMGSIEPNRGLETLENLIVDDRVQAGVLPIDWPKFFERIPAGSEPTWLTDMAREARDAASSASGPPVLLDQLRAVTPAERIDVALTFIRQQAARVLAMDETNLPDPRRMLNELGFDSLTAVEFCNRVSRSIGQHLNPAVMFDYPTLESFSGYVVREVLKLEVAAAEPATPEPAPAEDESREQIMTQVEGMSEEEMNAAVAAQLEKLGT